MRGFSLILPAFRKRDLSMYHHINFTGFFSHWVSKDDELQCKNSSVPIVIPERGKLEEVDIDQWEEKSRNVHIHKRTQCFHTRENKVSVWTKHIGTVASNADVLGQSQTESLEHWFPHLQICSSWESTPAPVKRGGWLLSLKACLVTPVLFTTSR